MLVLGLNDPSSKERLMERDQNLEKTLTAARIAETSKQHMKSLKDGAAKSRRWIQWTVQLNIQVEGHEETVVFYMGKIYALLLDDNATSVR